MEEKKQPLIFGEQSSNDNIKSFQEIIPLSRKEGGVKNEENQIIVKLDKGVSVICVKKDDIKYDEIKTLNDVIFLDNTRPDIIINFQPPLYKDFVNKQNQSIDTIIKIGDIVKVKNKYLDNKGEIPREVINLYFKSLNNMTVIVAVLNDNDFYIANRLEKCK